MKITPLDPWIRQNIAATQPQLTRQDLEAWQLQKLNELLPYVRAKSPYYQKLFAKLPEHLDSVDELNQFPFTTPDDIRHNPLKFICVSQDEIQRVVTLQSSGTTGEPKRIFFTAEDQGLTIDFFGVGMSTLTSRGERVLILLPGKTSGSVGDLLRLGLKRLGMDPIPYGPVRDPLHTLDVIDSKKINCLVGSPTQVLGLALRWKPSMNKPRSVLLSTDYVPMAIVKTLERAWGCEVFNHYGSTEMGLGGGVECSAHHGYHLREADLYFEIIDPITGTTVNEGEYGEVVFTTLTRRGMPLIRYRMDDRSRFISGMCPCGTYLKVMEKISGRFSGFVPVGNGFLRIPEFDEALFSIPGLLNFTVTMTEKSHKVSLLIEAQALFSTDSSRSIKEALEAIPVLKDLDIIVHCQYNPGEPGSLFKRIILDKRGQSAGCF